MTKMHELDGIYSVAYTGIVGSGMAILLFKEGEIVGADIAGVTYDGRYKILDDQSILGNLCMTIPPNTPLVTGTPTPEAECKINFDIKLPSEFIAPEIIPLNLPIGKVNAIFRKMRTL